MAVFDNERRGLGKLSEGPAYVAGSTTSDRATRIVNWVERQRTKRREWENTVYRDREWYDGTNGQHYWQMDYASGMLRPQRVPRWRVQWTGPFVMASVEQLAAMVATSVVQFYGVPASSDPDDRQSAQAVTRFCRYIHHAEDMQRKRMEFTRHSLIDGGAYFKTWWDQSANRARIETVQSCEVFVEPTSSALERSRVVVHETWPHIDTVRGIFGSRKLSDVESQPEKIPSDVRRRMEMAQPYGGIVDSEDLDGLVALREVYVRPSSDRPRGRFYVLVQEKIVHEGDLPYFGAGIEVPLVYLPYLKKPGSYHGLSLVSVMRPTVRLIEQMVSANAEANYLSIWPKWLVPEGQKIEGKFTTEPGEIVRVDPNMGTPVRLDGGAASAVYMGFVQQIIVLLQQHTGVTDVSHGQIPKRIESGIALAIAREADKNRASMMHVDVDQKERDAVWMAVRLERTYGTGERHAQVIGKTRGSEVLHFTNATFDGTVDVHVVSAESLSDNKATREQQILTRYTMGLIDSDTANRYLGMPVLGDEIASWAEQNAQRARNENEKMKGGEDAVTLDWFDHKTHIFEHQAFVIDHMDEMDETTLRVMQEHIADHEFLMMARAMGQQMTMPQAGGAARSSMTQPPSAGSASASDDTLHLTDASAGGSEGSDGDSAERHLRRRGLNGRAGGPSVASGR